MNNDLLTQGLANGSPIATLTQGLLIRSSSVPFVRRKKPIASFTIRTKPSCKATVVCQRESV
jgi:hypothetical protein